MSGAAGSDEQRRPEGTDEPPSHSSKPEEKEDGADDNKRSDGSTRDKVKPFHCPICNKNFHGNVQFEDHKIGKKHKYRAAAMGQGQGQQTD